MPRKPTIEDAILLALLEAGDKGLDVTSWFLFNKPEKFDLTFSQFNEIIKKLKKEGLVEQGSLENILKLTEKGKFKAYNIESELKPEDYISLVANVSPIVELKKRIENIEVLIVSGFLLLLGIFN